MKPARVYPELNRRGFILPLVIILVLTLVTLTTAILWQFKFKTQNAILQTQTQTPSATQQPQKSQTTQSATPDETASWKTYTNKVYFYSVKYPQEFHVDSNGSPWPENISLEQNSDILIVPPIPSEDKVTINIVVRASVSQLLNPLDLKSKKSTQEGISDTAIISVDGKKASTYTALSQESPTPSSTKFIRVINNNLQYSISFIYENKYQDDALKTAGLILSTFKFTQ